MTERINALRELLFADAHKAYRKEDLGLSILDEQTKDLPFAIRKAMAFACAVENMPIFLLKGDLICGGRTVYTLPTYITEDEIHWGNHNFECGGYNNIFDNSFNLGQDERGFGRSNSSIPAYYKILPIGIPALIADVQARLAAAEEEPKKTYYQSVLIALRACLNGMTRYERLCLEQACSCEDDARKKELEQMAANLAVLQKGAPQTYWQALQLVYFIHFLIWVEGGYLVPLGRMDIFLHPFMQRDIDNGILTSGFALELLEAFFIKLNYEIDRTHGESIRINSDTGQSITTGGCDPLTGEPTYNDLSMMILDAKCDLKTTDPKVHLRVNAGMSDAFWKKAAYLNSLGMGFPTYENDDIIISAFMSHPEYKLEHARDYAASGCWEMTIQGRSLNRNMGCVCCLRMIEWAMNNGKFALGIPNAETAQGLIGDRYGIPTGEPEWFDTYEKFFNAVKVQMKHHIDTATSYANRSMVSPSPFYSAVMDGPIEKGCDFDACGVPYDETDYQLAAVSNAADALYAIRKLVYIDKRYTLRQFNEILLNNWKDNEALRQEILSFPKFGNNDKEVDAIADALVKYFVQEVTKQRNAAGQTYRARVSSATSYIYGSRILGASADGRKARDAYADNLSPMFGADRSGPTGIVLSCGNIDFSGCAGGAVLDMKFHPSSLSTDESREKFIALLKTFCRLGGMQVQCNVVDNKVLLDAQKHPENYRDLMVRIWGFSTYFVAIDKHWQDHIIARSTLSL